VFGKAKIGNSAEAQSVVGLVHHDVLSPFDILVVALQVKEIIYPLGAKIDVREVRLGDETMSVLEIWGAEYQENDCLLIDGADRDLLETVCARERCLMQVCCPLPFSPCREVSVSLSGSFPALFSTSGSSLCLAFCVNRIWRVSC
jgi:hypothetical protein